MKIRLISDLHTEFWPQNKFSRVLDLYLPPRPDDKDSLLCCSGDLGIYALYKSTYLPLFYLLGQRFRHVIAIPGNHSWYHSDVWGAEAAFWREQVPLPENVSYLDNGTVVFEGITFVATCLWTEFDGDRMAQVRAQAQLADFKAIEVRDDFFGHLLRPEEVIARHEASVAFIEQALEEARGRPTVVLTHHAPSKRSVPYEFKNSTLNPAFCTSLDELIMRYEPLIWCHGHTHTSARYQIGQSQIICNPLGYHGVKINTHFDPNLTVKA